MRLNILAENYWTKPNLYCEIDGRVTKPYLRRIAGPEYLCKWGNYFLDCPVGERPDKFSIVNGRQGRHDVIN